MDKETKIEKYLLNETGDAINEKSISVGDIEVEIIYSKNGQKLENCMLEILKQKITKGR